MPLSRVRLDPPDPAPTPAPGPDPVLAARRSRAMSACAAIRSCTQLMSCLMATPGSVAAASAPSSGSRPPFAPPVAWPDSFSAAQHCLDWHRTIGSCAPLHTPHIWTEKNAMRFLIKHSLQMLQVMHVFRFHMHIFNGNVLCRIGALRAWLTTYHRINN